MQDRPIFAIFQGGGAKGIAHVGAMKAAEENGFAFAAVAGTSAGAVVATLIAAGFSADDVFDPNNTGENILRWFGKGPLDFFGKSKWRRFNRCRLWWPWRFFTPTFWRVAWTIYWDRGYFSTDEIRNFVNTVLRWKLNQLYGAYSAQGSDWKVPDRVKFKDLDPSRFPGDILPLKIVTTNMRTGGLEIFDITRTPNVEIADAVAASIAIPVIFKPVTMQSRPDDGPYLDGGLVSNLPIWVFAEEKLAWERDWPTDPPIPIVGFSLVSKARSKEPQSKISAFTEFFLRVADTALSGSQVVSQQFVDDLEVIKLETTFGMLDFDKPWDSFCNAYHEGKTHAVKELTAAMILKPDLVQRELKKVVLLVKRNIDHRRIRSGLPRLKHFRGNLIQRLGQHSLRVTYAINMETDADDRLILDERGNGAAEAFREKALAFQDFTQSQALDLMTKYERALVRQGLKGAICVPIFDSGKEWEKPKNATRNKPLGVFCFDSDEDIQTDYNDPAFKEFIVKRSALLQGALKI